MATRIGAYVRENHLALLCLFLILGGGTAYAANEWTGENIVDGSLTSADYKNNDIRSSDVRDESLTGNDIANGSLNGGEIGQATIGPFNIIGDSLTNQVLGTGSVRSDEVLNGSLTGADIAGNSSLTGNHINEGSLAPTLEVKRGTLFMRRHLPEAGYYMDVLHKDVGTGVYLVLATYTLQNKNMNEHLFHCRVIKSGEAGVLGLSGDWLGSRGNSNSFETETLVGTTVVPPGPDGRIIIQCRVETEGDEVYVNDAAIHAIKIRSVE